MADISETGGPGNGTQSGGDAPQTKENTGNTGTDTQTQDPNADVLLLPVKDLTQSESVKVDRGLYDDEEQNKNTQNKKEGEEGEEEPPVEYKDPFYPLTANKKPGLSYGESLFLRNIFTVPVWGVKEWINERGEFLKRTENILGEPTWFYFKIFFRFESQYGLLGNIVMNKDYLGQNTAKRYLLNNVQRYYQENVLARYRSLVKFVRTLSFICNDAPWTFMGVKDLDKALAYDLNKNKEKKSITIEMSQEAIDMKLSSLFDLYRFAAFDFDHDKEIIPENLRKFEMDIVLFQVPLKYYQTSIKDIRNNSVGYKNLWQDSDLTQRMSFHLFSFQNCEFDVTSMSSLFSGTINNEKPFELKASLKIDYDKCYHHSLNEWISTMVGDSGFQDFNADKDEKVPNPAAGGFLEPDEVDSDYTRRNKILKYGIDNARYYNESSNNYKAIIEASEALARDAMRSVPDRYALGNIYEEQDWGDIGNYFKEWGKNLLGGFKDAYTKPFSNLFGSNKNKRDMGDEIWTPEQIQQQYYNNINRADAKKAAEERRMRLKKLGNIYGFTPPPPNPLLANIKNQLGVNDTPPNNNSNTGETTPPYKKSSASNRNDDPNNRRSVLRQLGNLYYDNYELTDPTKNK